MNKDEYIKKLKTTREWYFTHLPTRPQWGDQFEFWLAGSYCRRNHPCQILWQSVQGFQSSDTPNFALLHRNSWSPLQQCKHYRATLWLFLGPTWVKPPKWHLCQFISVILQGLPFYPSLQKPVLQCQCRSPVIGFRLLDVYDDCKKFVDEVVCTRRYHAVSWDHCIAP